MDAISREVCSCGRPRLHRTEARPSERVRRLLGAALRLTVQRATRAFARRPKPARLRASSAQTLIAPPPPPPPPDEVPEPAADVADVLVVGDASTAVEIFPMPEELELLEEDELELLEEDDELEVTEWVRTVTVTARLRTEPAVLETATR